MRRLKRRFVRLSSLGLPFALVALVATACQEAPSYAVRWRIAPRPDEVLPPTAEPQDEEMTNPTLCTRSGVSKVEVWIFDELDRMVDQFTRPCFPERFRREGGAVRGATLRPGDYTALVVGTRANGVPWGECEDDTCGVPQFLQATFDAGLDFCDDGACNIGLDSCDCTTFNVVADEITRIPDFELTAPPDCEDGIDGDADGLVDQLDPGCQLGFSESTPVLIPELALSLSVLSGNPNAVCKSIGVGVLGLSIDGNPLDAILCRVGITRFSTPLAVGAHELTVVGTTSGGDPRTVEKTIAFEVDDRGVTTPDFLEVDFADVDLLEPLEATIKFQPTLRTPDGTETVTCLDSRIAVDDFRFRLFDLGGRLVEPALNTSSNVLLDGTSSVCQPPGSVSLASNVSSLDTVSWGGYLLEFEAYNADGELCWSNADDLTPLEPADPVPVVAELVEGAPANCFDG